MATTNLKSLQNQLQELLDLSAHINGIFHSSTSVLLQKHSELLRKRNLVRRNGEDSDDDFNILSFDVDLALRSLQVLEIRREIRAVCDELNEVNEQLKGEEPSRNWFDYIEDTMEYLYTVLKAGLDAAVEESLKPNLYDTPSSSPKDIYNATRVYRDFSSPSKKFMPGCNYYYKSPSYSSSKSSSTTMGASPLHGSFALQQEPLRSNFTRRLPIDTCQVSAGRFFIGNHPFLQSYAKACPTILISDEQMIADTTGMPSHWMTMNEHLNGCYYELDSASKHLNQIIKQESGEEFVDALETPEKHIERSILNVDRKAMNIKELTALADQLMSRNSSLSSSILSAVVEVEDESHILQAWSTKEDIDHKVESSFTLSTTPSIPSTPLSCSPKSSDYKITLGRDKPTHLFAEEVTVGNPLRIGSGYGSYIVYTCTVKGQKGANIAVRKRYSDFINLRGQLLKDQPSYRKLVPKLPPKKVIGKFDAEFIEKRRNELEYFLTYVLLHPMLGATPVVCHWFIG
ncbi:hypothetical protein G9A89_017533 [Geosiphon pyriformis]|nr:hypothetical protein G9A89_017533 [Geosiphon pyriformis]